MSIPELARLARRHWIAMLVVVIVTAAVGFGFRHTKPMYQDSGTVLFSPTPSLQRPGVGAQTLIVTADLMVVWLNGPQGTRQVFQAGGTGSYQFALVNSYDEEYPVYSEPLATLSATSYNPAVAQRTFEAALHVVQQELLAQQAAHGVPFVNRFHAYLVGNSTGPVAMTGYPKRTYAGLILLALMAAYFTGTLLDRHPGWRSALRARFRKRGGPQPPSHRTPLPARESSSA